MTVVRLLLLAAALLNVTCQLEPPARLVVKLLIMLPMQTEEQFGNDDTTPVINQWDKGLEILPGARLAVDQINNISSILPDSSLELQVVNIEQCLPNQFASNINALIPFAEIARSSNFIENITLGLVGGPFCPPLLSRLVSPLAARSHQFQMLASTSATIPRDDPHINFITPSTETYYEAVYAMMREFQWKKILIIAEEFFQGATTVKGSHGLNITYRQFFSSSPSFFADIRKSEKNIVFASVRAENAASVLCGAQEESLVYPDYAWIFHDSTPEDILDYANTTRCSAQTLETALSGSFFLSFRFEQSPSARIISGDTYSKYVDRLSIYRNHLERNPYANLMYDSVWAFALTLNRTGYSLQDYLNTSRRESLVSRMNSALSGISYEGASGSIDFGNSGGIEGMVDIFYYNNIIYKDLVGAYHQPTGNITIENYVIATVPNDSLSHVYQLVPVALVALLSTLVVICLILNTALLALFIHYRNNSDIKAASPFLSYIMFFGCYILFASTLIHAIVGGISISGYTTVIVCGAVIIGDSLGVNLIFTTLLLRMLRVYRIFSYFGKTGQLWSNKMMSLVVLLVASGDIVLILIWSLVDTFTLVDVTKFVSTATPPYYETKQFCHSNHLSIWFGILMGKIGILFVIVLFLAIKTRKIQRSNFKDTKKVNVYIFQTVVIVGLFMALYFLLKSLNNKIGVYMMIYLAFGITLISCQLFLFVPKVTSPILSKYGYEVQYSSTKRRRTLLKKESKSTLRSMVSLSLK